MKTPSCNDHEAIKETLLGRHYTPADIPCLDTPGVYALFLAAPAADFGAIIVPETGVIYVGMTDSSLNVRYHFQHKHSGFSSPRRTLGAVLKTQLQLCAIRRSGGLTASSVTNYRFAGDGEERLTAWMHRNLVCGLATVHHCVRMVERHLIAELRPPLNLTDWSNPQRPILAVLRNICRQEARACTAAPWQP
jgi:hypothetical protein